MKPNPREEAERWLRQAENDLEFARVGANEGYYAQSCFYSHQAAEKALKALVYSQGARFVPGHSVSELLKQVAGSFPDMTRYQDAAGRLDQYYLTSRYPNTLPGSAPYEIFSHDQAQEASTESGKLVLEIRNIISQSE